MLNEERNIDRIFREGLQNREEEFSASLWDNISEKLDENKTTSSIDKVFAEKLKNHQEEVPDNLWNKISENLDEKTAAVPVIDAAFKSLLHNCEEEVPEGIWNKISDKLDAKTEVAAIDSLFSKGLENHEEKLPPFVWNNVADGIDRNKRKKRIFYIRTIAASIAILLSFTAGILFTDFETNNLADLDKTNNKSVNEKITIPNTDLNNSIEELVSNVKGNKKTIKYAQANVHKSSFNELNEDFEIKEAGNLSLEIETVEDIEINVADFSRKENMKNTEIAEKPDTNSVMVVSSVMHRKTYATGATYNPNTVKVVKPKEKSGWFIGGYFSPVYSFRNANANSSYTQPRRASAENITKEIQTKDFYDEQEAGTYSLSSGVNIEYKTKNNWSLQSGIYITSIGQATDNISQNLISDIQQKTYVLTTSAGSISVNDDHNFSSWEVPEPESPEMKSTVELLQDFEYLEIPMNVRYNILNDNSKVSISLIGGISTNVLLKNRAFLQSDKQKYEIGKTNNINKFIYNSNLGLGIGYKFSKKISMNFEPSFKYSLVPINKNYPIYYRPYYFTVFTGINYKF